MTDECPITVAEGDGIGPEIMKATLSILEAAGARLSIEKVSIGEKVYLSGQLTGIDAQTWESLRRTKVFLKAPITTPQGGGYKSLNVTIRGKLGLYANVRPCQSYGPFIATKHPKMNLVIIRENEEDLYTGIEYRQTQDVCEALKLISYTGSEKIIRYAFEYAKSHGRKKVTCCTKDNILKMTDGLFHKVFEKIGSEYPELQKEHWIIDIGAAKIADTPELFDVIVLPNLYGDILSDVAAQLSGSVGLAGSANIGEHGAMFEAIHGSAPKRAGQNIANPSGLILASVLMLVHINQPSVASLIHNAWLRTIEEGIHTCDIFRTGVSKVLVGTLEFTQAVIERLGQKPQELKAISYEKVLHVKGHHKSHFIEQQREWVGVDLYFFASSLSSLEESLDRFDSNPFKRIMITNRGVKAWPDPIPETSYVDHWRVRFMKEGSKVTYEDLLSLLKRVSENNLDLIKVENLYLFDNHPGFSHVERLETHKL
jgi:isocitrate dehydrogenase